MDEMLARIREAEAKIVSSSHLLLHSYFSRFQKDISFSFLFPSRLDTYVGSVFTIMKVLNTFFLEITWEKSLRVWGENKSGQRCGQGKVAERTSRTSCYARESHRGEKTVWSWAKRSKCASSKKGKLFYVNHIYIAVSIVKLKYFVWHAALKKNFIDASSCTIDRMLLLMNQLF